MYSPSARTWEIDGLCFGIRCCDSRCIVWLHNGDWVDNRYEFVNRSTRLATFDRRFIFMLFRHQNLRKQQRKQKGGNLLTAYASNFLLTITNLVTILAFLAIFSGLGMATNHTTSQGLLLVIGVFVGSALWWLLLSNIAGIFAKHISDGSLRVINYMSGFILLGFGMYALFF